MDLEHHLERNSRLLIQPCNRDNPGSVHRDSTSDRLCGVKKTLENSLVTGKNLAVTTRADPALISRDTRSKKKLDGSERRRMARRTLKVGAIWKYLSSRRLSHLLFISFLFLLCAPPVFFPFSLSLSLSLYSSIYAKYVISSEFLFLRYIISCVYRSIFFSTKKEINVVQRVYYLNIWMLNHVRLYYKLLSWFRLAWRNIFFF